MKKIVVQAYSGHRAEERPTKMYLNGKMILIEDILRQWIEEECEAGERRTCFQTRGNDGKIYRLCYYHERQTWFLQDNP